MVITAVKRLVGRKWLRFEIKYKKRDVHYILTRPPVVVGCKFDWKKFISSLERWLVEKVQNYGANIVN